MGIITACYSFKKKQRIFQKKQRGRPYKTLPFDKSYRNASAFFEKSETNKQAIKDNLHSIRKYRNQAIHYYNNEPTQHCIYQLSQSAILNYINILKKIFNENISDEMNIVLLPLSFNNQPSSIDFFNSPQSDTNSDTNNAFVSDFVKKRTALEKKQADMRLFVTQCTVKIESTNNIKSSDFTAQYDKDSPLVAIQKTNPDHTHPFFQKDIIGNQNKKRHKKLRRDLTQYQFQAIVFKYRVKTQAQYCWQSTKGGSPRYSDKVIELINGLSDEAIQQAIEKYKKRLKQHRDKKRS